MHSLGALGPSKIIRDPFLLVLQRCLRGLWFSGTKEKAEPLFRSLRLLVQDSLPFKGCLLQSHELIVGLRATPS